MAQERGVGDQDKNQMTAPHWLTPPVNQETWIGLFLLKPSCRSLVFNEVLPSLSRSSKSRILPMQLPSVMARYLSEQSDVMPSLKYQKHR